MRPLTLYWDEYETAVGSTGAIQLDIPIDKIESLIMEKGNELLQLEQEPEIKALHPDPNTSLLLLTMDHILRWQKKNIYILNEFDAKVTSFILSNQVDYYPSLVQRVAEENHETGNHTETYPDLTKADSSWIKVELDFTNERIKEIIERYPPIIRPPYGAFNNVVIAQATKLNLPIVMWSVDSLDWKSRNAAINKVIMDNITNGSIILILNIHKTTTEALSTILNNLKTEGTRLSPFLNS